MERKDVGLMEQLVHAAGGGGGGSKELKSQEPLHGSKGPFVPAGDVVLYAPAGMAVGYGVLVKVAAAELVVWSQCGSLVAACCGS
jgi:hypothetical protein